MTFDKTRLPYAIIVGLLVGVCIVMGGDLGIFVSGVFPYLLLLLLL